MNILHTFCVEFCFTISGTEVASLVTSQVIAFAGRVVVFTIAMHDHHQHTYLQYINIYGLGHYLTLMPKSKDLWCESREEDAHATVGGREF